MIRPLSLGLLESKKESGKFLFHKAFDSVKNEVFYRPLGGGIEFKESSKKALVREFQEEIDTEIVVCKLLETFENIFSYEGNDGHEIVFLYKIELSSEEDHRDQYDIIENGKMIGHGVWMSLSEIRRDNARVYPLGIEKFL